MAVLRAAALALIVSAATSLACSSSKGDCTCVVENNGERRTLACGETSCVGGTSVACGDNNQIVQRGPCTDQPGSPGPSGTPSPDSGTATPPDQSCDDLRSFCSSSCSRPATTSADCQSTASAGDSQACASWQLSNAALCRP